MEPGPPSAEVFPSIILCISLGSPAQILLMGGSDVKVEVNTDVMLQWPQTAQVTFFLTEIQQKHKQKQVNEHISRTVSVKKCGNLYLFNFRSLF